MDLTGQQICKTYPRIIQIDTGSNTIQDGLGNVISLLPTTASYAVSASYATSASYEINYETSSSYAETSSISSNLVAESLTTPAPAYQEGVMFWDSSSHTYAIYGDSPNVTLQIGQETLVRVTANEYIPNGSPVYISGSDNLYPIAALALSCPIYPTKCNVIGISTEDINSGSTGYITLAGEVHDIDTSGYHEGTTLYLAPYISGSYVTTPPEQPFSSVICGTVLNSSVSGSILVNIVRLPQNINTSVGVVNSPTITDLGGGVFNVGTSSVNLNELSTGKGRILNYQINSASFAISSSFLDAQYLCATYTAGSASYIIETNKSNVDDIQTVLIYTITAGAGGAISYTSWDEPGVLLSNKLHDRLVDTHGIERESGLLLGESGSRYVTITAGYVWQGTNRVSLSSINSGTGDRLILLSYSGSTFSGSLITQYENARYNDATGLHTLGNNNYVVNWVYRGIGSLNSTVIMLGNEYSKYADAVASQPPTPPSELNDIAILIGRAIYEKNGLVADEIDTAFTKVFVPAGITDHNLLNNLQGGDGLNQFYHLTSASFSGTGTGVVVRQINPHLSGSVQITGSLDVSGSAHFQYGIQDNLKTISSTYTSSKSDKIIFISSSLTAIDMKLHPASDLPGKSIYIKLLSNLLLTIYSSGSDSIEFDTYLQMENKGTSVQLIPSGNNWFVI